VVSSKLRQFGSATDYSLRPARWSRLVPRIAFTEVVVSEASGAVFRDTTTPRYSDRGRARRIGEAVNQPNREPAIALIKRDQDEGAFDPELSVAWIEHALYALIRQGCEDANRGDLLLHTVAPTVIRTFEHGICTPD